MYTIRPKNLGEARGQGLDNMCVGIKCMSKYCRDEVIVLVSKERHDSRTYCGRLLVCVGVTVCLGCPPTYVVDSTIVQ